MISVDYRILRRYHEVSQETGTDITTLLA